MKLSNEELYLAETLADAIEKADGIERATLARLRYKTVCSKTNIGEHDCSVATAHGYCCDTCLQSEIHELWKIGVHTVGSCCGHGRKQAFIQVLGGDGDIEKMHELGYEKLPPEENGDGQFCYKPKTYLPTLAKWSEPIVLLSSAKRYGADMRKVDDLVEVQDECDGDSCPIHFPDEPKYDPDEFFSAERGGK